MKKNNNNQELDNISCWGTYKKSKKCSGCQYKDSCYVGKKDTSRQNTENSMWTGFREYDDSKKVVFMSSEKRIWKLPDGKIVEPSSINMELIIWALREGYESPNSARALALMLSGAKNLSEIATISGRTRQAERKAIASELGIGKKKVPESKLLTLSTREFLVYQCYSKGLSSRKTAKALNLHQTQVMRCVHLLKQKGLEMCSPRTASK